MKATDTKCFDIFRECVRAMHEGELIVQESQKDKEFHFQNWCQARLENVGVHFEGTGRNIYPDFCLVEMPEGYEIKGLAFPGREKDYDANSNVPTGFHNGRNIFYIFGRYPSDTSIYRNGRITEYPVIDLVICHGDFLNAQRDYVHKNKHIKGFGAYGDIMIRDRKMYVVPTPFALTAGTAGLATLILPEDYEIPDGFKCVGELNRVEGEELVVGYSFDLRTNEISAETVTNPAAGTIHMIDPTKSDSHNFFMLVFGCIQQAIDIIVSCVEYGCIPYIRYSVSLHYISLLSECMMDIDHIITLRFKMSIAFVVYQLCDKGRLASIDLEEFMRKNQTYNFNKRLFHTLAEHNVNKNNYLGHTIMQMVIDELESFYNIIN